jgi:glycosyltransferase involved in cell wall biosynthesis
MKILHLLASPVFSGPAETVINLALAQRALGHEVTVAIDRRRAGLSSEEPLQPKLAGTSLLDEGGLELSAHSPIWNVLRDTRRLRSRSVDVVHAHFSHDHWVARLGQPRNSVLVRSIHAPRSLRWSTPAADGFTVPMPELQSRLGQKPSRVLPALIDATFTASSDPFALRTQLAQEGTPLIGMVSTFQPSRRHALAIEAFSELQKIEPRARLLLIGDGVLEPALRAQVNALGLQDKVTFAGYRSGAAFVERLQILDQLWVLGLGNDWSARAALQARRCGVRVLAVAEGALPLYADVVVESLSTTAVRDAALRTDRRSTTLPNNAAVAEDVLELYRQCGATA